MMQPLRLSMTALLDGMRSEFCARQGYMEAGQERPLLAQTRICRSGRYRVITGPSATRGQHWNSVTPRQIISFARVPR